LSGVVPGWGGAVDEVVGEQFVEEDEIALALDLFGIAADHSLDGFTVGRGRHIGSIWLGHAVPALLSTLMRSTVRHAVYQADAGRLTM
jgi:hypothetical protein